jgi:formylglycine-generating enzyme required for sulfatase activity
LFRKADPDTVIYCPIDIDSWWRPQFPRELLTDDMPASQATEFSAQDIAFLAALYPPGHFVAPQAEGEPAGQPAHQEEQPPDPGQAAATAEEQLQIGAAQLQQGEFAEAEQSLQNALSHFRQSGDWLGQADALTALGILYLQQNLPADARPYFVEALAAIGAIQNNDRLANALTALAPHLPAELMGEALGIALSLPDEGARVAGLQALAPYLPQDLLAEALAAARTIDNAYIRVFALGALAPHLPERQRDEALAEALATARTLANAYIRVRALGELAPHLPQPQRDAVLAEALAAASTLDNAPNRAYALVALAPHLPEVQRNQALSEALAVARTLEDASLLADLLVTLAPHLPEELMREALAIAQSIRSESLRTQALAALAPYLSANMESPQSSALPETGSMSQAVRLTGRQVQALHDALLNAYSAETLRRMVRIELNVNLEAIAGGESLRDIVYRLIEWAERTGRTMELVAAAQRHNPVNAALRAFAATIPGVNLAPEAEPPARTTAGVEVETPRASMTRLRTVLASLYPDESDARRVVHDAGIDPAHIHFSGQAANLWHAILEEARKTAQLDALLAVALDEYGANQQLQDAVTALRSSQSSPMDIDMVFIPAGEFLMGSNKEEDKLARNDETPQHRLALPAFHIARTPVTNAQYSLFVRSARGRPPSYWHDGIIPPGKENHPVVHVSWHDAAAFCRWLSGQLGGEIRLPSEAEWEKAARGADGRIYPWGDQPPTAELCNFRDIMGDTTAVGHYPRGASPYGALDMAGNVWEWTSSRYMPYPYTPEDGREDAESSDGRTLRGGSWGSGSAYLVRCAVRNGRYPDLRNNAVGFRILSTFDAR